MLLNRRTSVARLTLGLLVASLAACGSDDTTSPPPAGAESILLTAANVKSLDSSAVIIKQNNPGDPDLASLVDSTLLVLNAGVTAKHIEITTDLTTAPLYFVGIHRVVTRGSGGSFSTWNVVGFDDPSHLANLVEVSGFAESPSATAPTSVSGAFGGAGVGNALLLQVNNAGMVTAWRSPSGTVSFSSDAASGACPGFTSTSTTPVITCTMETLHVHFTTTSTGSNGTRTATIASDVDVPTMRLTYTF